MSMDMKYKEVTRRNKTMISKEYLACMKSVATKYAASVFDTLYSYEYNPKLMRLWIIGGGGSLIKHFGVYDKDRVNNVEDI